MALARSLRPHLQRGLVGWLRGDAHGVGLVQAVLDRLAPAVRESAGGVLWAAGLASGVIVVCASGFFAARGAINAAPVNVLRAA